MVRPRPTLPSGHGEVLCRPPYTEWAGLAASNREMASGAGFEVGGVPAARLRAEARREAIEEARAFTARAGVDTAAVAGDPGLLIVTGHQPELYHPGVWVKNFLAERFAEENGAIALALVVDTDGFDSVTLSAPCLQPEVRRCTQYLAVGQTGGWYASAPVPTDAEIEDFCAGGDRMLASLPAPALRHHFASFCEALREAAPVAGDLAELVTFARRRYEAPAGTTYLELPVTALARTRAWGRFAGHLLVHAAEFAHSFNTELRSYRDATGTRSAAQPFPDLTVDVGVVETPLWVLPRGGVRATAFVAEADGGGKRLLAGDAPVGSIAPDGAVELDSGVVLAPKAVALTMFARLFLGDLFVHGVGGGRYDRVTDAVIERFFGVPAPAFAVASMTMLLPLGGHLVTDEDLAAVRAQLARLEHNPDALLAEAEFEDGTERERAATLATEKSALVSAIAQPGADKKVLGLRIKELNAELAELLAPMAEELRERLSQLEREAEASRILADRTYPFCLWSPLEIQDKVR